MDNEKLAKAIAALYTVVAETDLDDTDEVIQEAAWGLYGLRDCGAIDFSVLLVKCGLDYDVALDFCEVTEREYLYASNKPF